MRTSYANQIEKKQEQLEKLEEYMQKLQLRKQSIKLKMQSAKDAIDELNSKRHKKWYVDLEKEINRHSSQINLDVIPITDIVHYIIEETAKHQSKSADTESVSLKKVQEKEATVSTSEKKEESELNISTNPSVKEQSVKPDKDSKPNKAAEPVEPVETPLNQPEDKKENEDSKTNKAAEPVEPVEAPNEDSSSEPAWTPPETF